jgi:hypothetical protein
MKAIEGKLGRSLDGTRIGHDSHMRKTEMRQLDAHKREARRVRALRMLEQMGVDTKLIEWTPAKRAA